MIMQYNQHTKQHRRLLITKTMIGIGGKSVNFLKRASNGKGKIINGHLRLSKIFTRSNQSSFEGGEEGGGLKKKPIE